MGASSSRQRQAAGLEHRCHLLGAILAEPQWQPGVSGFHNLPETQPEPENGKHLLQRGKAPHLSPAVHRGSFVYLFILYNVYV